MRKIMRRPIDHTYGITEGSSPDWSEEEAALDYLSSNPAEDVALLLRETAPGQGQGRKMAGGLNRDLILTGQSHRWHP